MIRRIARTGLVLAILVGQCLGVQRSAWAQTDSDVPAPAPSETGSEKSALVSVRSTADSVTVAEITARMVAASGTVVVQGVAYRDLCNSPCSFKLEPGLHELAIYGEGVASTTRKFELKAGQNPLLVKPGSAALETGGAYLTAAGILTTLTGALFFVLFTETTEYHCEVDPSCPESTTASGTKKLALPLLLGGLAGTGLGIGLFVAGHSQFTTDAPGASKASEQSGVRQQAFGVTLRGTL
jgi:hypothetical protein